MVLSLQPKGGYTMWKAKKDKRCAYCGFTFTPTGAASKYCKVLCMLLNNSKHMDSGCREWKRGKTKDGYGIFRAPGRGIKVHREMWTINKGAIPDGMCICHTCDNPACINIDHLFLGTRKDNMIDMVRKGRNAKTGGMLNPRAILTEDNVREIRRTVAYHGCNIDCAKRFGVTVQTIEAVRSKTRGLWKGIV